MFEERSESRVVKQQYPLGPTEPGHPVFEAIREREEAKVSAGLASALGCDPMVAPRLKIKEQDRPWDFVGAATRHFELTGRLTLNSFPSLLLGQTPSIAARLGIVVRDFAFSDARVHLVRGYKLFWIEPDQFLNNAWHRVIALAVERELIPFSFESGALMEFDRLVRQSRTVGV